MCAQLIIDATPLTAAAALRHFRAAATPTDLYWIVQALHMRFSRTILYSATERPLTQCIEEEVLRALLEGRAGDRPEVASKLVALLELLRVAHTEAGTEFTYGVRGRPLDPLFKQLVARAKAGELPVGVRLQIALARAETSGPQWPEPPPRAAVNMLWAAFKKYLAAPLQHYDLTNAGAFYNALNFKNLICFLPQEPENPSLAQDLAARPRSTRDLHAILAGFFLHYHHKANTSESTFKKFIALTEVVQLQNFSDPDPGLRRAIFMRAAASLAFAQAHGIRVSPDRAAKILQDLEYILLEGDVQRVLWHEEVWYLVGALLGAARDLSKPIGECFSEILSYSDLTESPISAVPAAQAYVCAGLGTKPAARLLKTLEPVEVLPAVRSGALPFAAEVYASLRCGTCGRVPSITALQQNRRPFQLCSLCHDPAVGRFCCKEPCFAAFWRGGHKLVCAGRDKRGKKDGGPGGGGSGGGGGGGAGVFGSKTTAS
jgi:hypothetical protein